MPDETHKDHYSTSDMLEAARRLRSPGVSPRTGKKLKRRTTQPSKERRQLLRVMIIVALLLAAVAATTAYWWLTRNQEKSQSPGSTFLPTSPS